MSTPNVILARPHPFLVDAMTSVLEAAGFVPLRLTSAQELAGLGATGWRGAVISAAISAESTLSLGDAYTQLRARFPHLPVAFTALAGFDAVAGRLKSEAGVPPDVEIMPIARASLQHPGLGTRRTVLLLSAADLTERRGEVLTALGAHFSPASAR